MVKLKKNLLLTGLVGALNKQFVLKLYKHMTIVTAYPDMSNVVRTEKQKKENQKFRQAMAYARIQMADPESKAAYKAKAKGLQKPHNVAIADFYNPPEIREINTTDFQGQKGDLIRVNAIDDFKVMKVNVDITNLQGTLMETGEAEQLNKWNWIYRIRQSYPVKRNLIITAHAWDKPGNEAVANMTII